MGRPASPHGVSETVSKHTRPRKRYRLQSPPTVPPPRTVSAAGLTDVAVLATAAREGRVFVTHEPGYGRLIYRLGYPVPTGVVYIRRVSTTPDKPEESPVFRLLTDPPVPLEGCYVTLDGRLVRSRPLPPARKKG